MQAFQIILIALLTVVGNGKISFIGNVKVLLIVYSSHVAFRASMRSSMKMSFDLNKAVSTLARNKILTKVSVWFIFFYIHFKRD